MAGLTLSTPWFLVPITGPPLSPIELVSKPGGAVLGRHEQCEIHLPADVEKVSRYHARFTHGGGRWHVCDLGSRGGTFVNGTRLSPHVDMALSEGDLLRIVPWTFTLSSQKVRGGLRADDDSGRTQVRTVAPDATRPLAEELLALLLEYAAATHTATDESQLAELLLDAAIKGTRLPNAIVLRPVDTEGNFQVIASRMGPGAPGVSFSRTLINASSNGEVAEIHATFDGDWSQSIVKLNITSAICVPLMIGGGVVAYLYLDARGGHSSALRPGSGAFCVALGRIASLALTNFKRLEMEKREAAVRADLAAAAAAQKWIMPPRESRHGVFHTIGESRPGQIVGGDFFDIIPLDAHRLAIALGDVSGKGVSASVLMTAAQGFLHAALLQCTNPLDAVLRLNRFVQPRRPVDRFVTLWVGLFDATAGALTYVDCGHGYALLKRTDGTIELLDKGGGLPIGVDADYQYASEVVSMHPGESVMVVSDGIIEQYDSAPTGGPERRQFTVAGLRQSFQSAGPDEVAAAFTAVIRHAGTDRLHDDATAARVRWDAAPAA